MHVTFGEVLAYIRARDERDSGREAAPLRQAADAVLLDTTDFTLEQAVAAAVRLVEERLKRA
jgi:cytidylate kinase